MALMSREEAQAILPVVELMRDQSQAYGQQVMDLYRILEAENDELRRQLAVAQQDARRYWAIRELLSGRQEYA